MDDISTQPKTTPAPRRQGRGDGRSGAQKAYASENDVAALDASRQQRAPQTPSKVGSGSPAPTESNAVQTGSKQRNRNWPSKAKNAPTSPDSAQRGGRQTPPHRSVSMKPGTSTAFAGATFHASPAPSALPIPTFLAKSSCDSPVHRDAKDIVQEPSPPATDTDAPTPFRPDSSVPRNHESPLDFMFRAHREEKERQHRSIPISQNSNSSYATSPPTRSLFDPNTSPNPSTVPQTRRTLSRQISGGIDSSELDGTPGRPMGPAFSTPYQERIKAARSNSARPHLNQSQPEQPSQKPPPSDDPTEALKKFLFSGGAVSSQALPMGVTSASAPAAAQASFTAQPEPAHAKNVQAMENDLRRILKMDLTSNAPSPDRRFFSR
ncbi:hypothetical protein TOPH_03718 [Tolypocladium ophioglossoides CBS 100239]|uniref:Proteophosphoglycan 5 n=1 Tax=Tolypocladium ophioglossoides (strain CBS 100239) TaxID=1163406 RepID=A0A0L0NCI2_TOLOC|nr:hypothetical protein TOPH_03718 [Tolypocladium ophioglossoides CBS 100239]